MQAGAATAICLTTPLDSVSAAGNDIDSKQFMLRVVPWLEAQEESRNESDDRRKRSTHPRSARA
jgi:hypothetical protein